MADKLSIEARSYNMSRIRSKNTKPELLVRRFLFSKGYRYKLHDKNLPGKPDIVMPKFKVVIFVNGCFWHGHEACKYASVPKTRTEWWQEKIDKNKKSDIKSIETLTKMGWQVITIFQCELKSNAVSQTLNTLLAVLNLKLFSRNVPIFGE